jgi:tetratricopeptide (TPR) repeat protein
MKKIIFFIVNLLLVVSSKAQSIDEFADQAWAKNFEKDYYGEILVYDKAIALYPSHNEFYVRRSFAKENVKDYQGALEDLTKADKIFNLNNYSGKGRLKFKLEDYRGAIYEFNKAIIDFPHASDYEYRADAKFSLKDYLGAITDYSQALLEYKDFPNIDVSYIYFNRGLAKLNLKQTNSGCLDLSKAGELGVKEVYDIIKENCN